MVKVIGKDVFFSHFLSWKHQHSLNNDNWQRLSQIHKYGNLGVHQTLIFGLCGKEGAYMSNLEGLASWFTAVFAYLSQVLKNVASLLSAELRLATLFMAIIWFCMAFRLVHTVICRATYMTLLSTRSSVSQKVTFWLFCASFIDSVFSQNTLSQFLRSFCVVPWHDQTSPEWRVCVQS